MISRVQHFFLCNWVISTLLPAHTVRPDTAMGKKTAFVNHSMESGTPLWKSFVGCHRIQNETIFLKNSQMCQFLEIIFCLRTNIKIQYMFQMICNKFKSLYSVCHCFCKLGFVQHREVHVSVQGYVFRLSTWLAVKQCLIIHYIYVLLILVYNFCLTLLLF